MRKATALSTSRRTLQRRRAVQRFAGAAKQRERATRVRQSVEPAAFPSAIGEGLRRRRHEAQGDVRRCGAPTSRQARCGLSRNSRGAPRKWSTRRRGSHVSSRGSRITRCRPGASRSSSPWPRRATRGAVHCRARSDGGGSHVSASFTGTAGDGACTVARRLGFGCDGQPRGARGKERFHGQ